MKLNTLILLAALSCGSLHAQTIEVRQAWIRTSVTGQKATGGFMKITARDRVTLVAVSSPVAGVAEVHEMKMDGDVMTMRAIRGGLDLPAGKTVEFKPGGYHVMLMDLKTPLIKDSIVPLTLAFRDAKGIESKVELNVPVAASAPAGPTDGKAAKPAHQH